MTDGPFAETKEQLGGYYLVEAKNLDEAIEIAARIPRPTLRDDRGAARMVVRGGRAVRRGRAVADGVPRGVRAGGRDLIRVARRLRPRRGRRPGGLRRARRALAARTASRQARRAWIVTTARNRAIDRLRRERDAGDKRPELAAARREPSPPDEEDDDVSTIPDERLRADLHLLPPGARARGAGGAHASHCSAA